MSQPIVVVRLVRLPQDRAFTVFTRDIGRWWVRRPTPWGSQGLLHLECRAGGEVREGDALVGQVMHFEVGLLLVFTLHGSQVEIRFEDAPTGTRITLTHRDWEGWTGALSAQAFFDIVSVFWADALSRV